MIFSKLKSYYKNMKLRKKIIANFLVLCIVPLAFISIMNYRVSYSHTSNTMTDFANLFASQLNSEIDNYVVSIDNISKSIINDTNLLRFLSHEVEYLISERISYRRIIENHFHNMTLQKPDLSDIYIIGTSEIIYKSSGLDEHMDYAGFETLSWFEELRKSSGSLIITSAGTDEDVPQMIVIGRALRDVHGKTHGIIAFIVRSENMIRVNDFSDKIIDRYDIGLRISNSKGDLLYEIPSEKVISPNNFNSVVLSHVSPKYGLSTSINIPRITLFEALYTLRNINSLLVLSMILFAIFLSLVFSHNITKPLSMLVKSMRLFQDQKYELIPEDDRDDEIGDLTRTYNRMITKINTLINEVYISKLSEKRAQYYALQNQINPHMLYNTLENIRMKAILNGDREVADMIKKLGSIFHMTLAKGKKNHTVMDEINYINAYVDLLNIRNDNLYEMDIELSEEILRSSLLRFSLQPIVENCIVHGFKNLTKQCMISIRGHISDSGIILQIIDNGKGMDQKYIDEIKRELDSPSDILNDPVSGIGLKNVYDRIKLEYGDDYYLNIYSEGDMKGTIIELLIPIRKAGVNV